jgi:transcriptional regulator with XRE-family HTH domain
MATGKTFGAFFRAKRKALGITLREFCRRNGFDPGNVSRLERGLMPPPQATQLLESYAKALKIESGTLAWDRFFELASTEAGRIPADVLESERDSLKLPSLFRELRAQGQGHTSWVNALDLETWADTLNARATLPQLVRRLIRATGKDLGPVEFPAHEQTQRPGWDGIAEAGQADAFVPAGTSAWELGVEKNPQKKAEEDFGKRAKAPLGLDSKQTTFVVVTPRKWQKKAEWRRSKEALGVWKGVRVYDSASLEEWLEQAPAVDAWLAGVLGKRPTDLTAMDEYWANLQAVTDPSLKPEVFLASREEEIKKLDDWLAGPPGALVIEARSPFEALEFVAACSREPSREDWFAARALIVEGRDAWRNVVASTGAGLLLIAHPSLAIEPEMVADAVRRGHRVLVFSNQTPRERVETLRLPRAYRHDLATALRSSGLDEERANRYAREAGGSLTVLKRLLGRYPGTTEPEWSRPAEARALVPMLLAGSWDDTSDADRSAIERLSGRRYEAVAEEALRWLNAPDSPLTRAGSHWNLVSRDDSWFLLAPALIPADVCRYEEVALEVLAENDAAYELRPEERWQARLQKKAPRYSQALRTGLAETLVLLGARSDRLIDVVGIRGNVAQIVHKLLDRRDWLRWASLSSQLPLLAEAAPEAFLEAAERDLKQAKPALGQLFGQEGVLGWPLGTQAGLLWALEGLAWDRTLLPQVTMILAALDDTAPRVNSGNSASRSLLEIFMPWLPQTTAPVEERVKVLQKLVRVRPEAGWRLLVGLLPNQQPISTPTYRPLWRDWALAWRSSVSTASYWQQVIACGQLLVEQLGDDIARWKALIQQFENLPGPTQTEFLERLSGFAGRTVDEETRRVISEMIREKICLHRKFADTNWALQEGTLTELEKVRSRFEPDDAVRRNAWLFRQRWQISETPESETERLDRLCPQALREILGAGGWQDLRRLIEVVQAPEDVGAVLATIGFAESDGNIFPELLLSGGEHAARFAGGYIRNRFQKQGWDWVNRLDMRMWSAKEVAQFLTVLPFERKTWDFAGEQDAEVATTYWRHVWPYTRGADGDEATFAAEMFIWHGRASAAFTVLQMALHQRAAIQPSLLMDALEAWIESRTRAGEGHQGVSFQIQLLFQELQRRAADSAAPIGLDRLAMLEWAYLGLLDGHPASPVTLHAKLKDDPGFFVDVLGLVFRPKNQPLEGNEVVSEEVSQRAQNAYRLLRSWHELPGAGDGQTVDEKTLLAWVKKARSMAEDRGLLEICDSRIGEVLAHAPAESDGSWPCVAVRDALEEIGSDEVFGGFSVGIYNKRGVFSKTLKEGGAQERTLAEKYRQYADASNLEWTKTAATLRRIAEGYEEHARREDAQATPN